MRLDSKLLLTRSSSFRPDLEGIRGIALIAILFTHLIERPTGGFVFLDLFFVLSGYLITGLLIREYDKTGTIKLWRFSRRRIRRLAPAATAVILATVSVAYLLFPLPRAHTAAQDGIWAMLLSANWRFVATGTDYFATWMPQSPLLHYWSLAVEEQFYLVWPLLILGAMTLGTTVFRRRRFRAQRPTFLERYGVVIAMISVASLASFAWGVVQAGSNPEVSYLSTLTRVWQLGFGALLYFGNGIWARISRPARIALAWGGLAALLVLAFTYTPAIPYPGFAALAPVFATAAIVVSGVGGSASFTAATNPVSRYLGQISYSAYLWHWPLFVFFAAVFGKESPFYLFAAIPLALLLGALSFHLIENPVRESQWLEPSARWSRMTSWQRFDHSIKRLALFAVPLATVLVTFTIFSLNNGTQSIPARSNASQTPEPVEVSSEDQANAEQQALVEAGVLSALKVETWPAEVVETINSGSASPADLLTSTCLDVTAAHENECVYGADSLPKTAVLLGDSVALSWVPGLAPALNDLGYQLRLLNHSQCPFTDVSVSGSFEAGSTRPGYPEKCNDHRAWAFERTVSIGPDLLIVADGEAEMQTLLLPTDANSNASYWQSGVESSMSQVGEIPTVLLASPPQAASISDCFTRVATIQDCTERMSKQWREQFSATVKAQQATQGNLHVINTLTWFCSTDGWCPPFASGQVIRSDRQHLAEGYSSYLSPVLRETIGQALEQPTSLESR